MNEQKIDQLKNYFSKRDEISMAFLFGSYSKSLFTRRSDVDIAVYFKPTGGEIDLESDKDYPGENEITSGLENILGIETDLIILNQAPAHLASTIITEGVPIIIKDRGLYLDFLLRITNDAIDWREFAEDYYKIYLRSASLSPEDRIRLEKIIIYIESELKDFSKFSPFTQTDYQNNVSKRREVERWVENIVNSSIDIAKILLASEKKPIAETYEKILSSLDSIGFDSETAKILGGFAKLRNLLAHQYLDIRFSKITKFLDKASEIYPKLINFAKKILSVRPSENSNKIT